MTVRYRSGSYHPDQVAAVYIGYCGGSTLTEYQVNAKGQTIRERIASESEFAYEQVTEAKRLRDERRFPSQVRVS